jgi:hypothetical protein
MNQNLMEKLKAQYLSLVKEGLQIQKRGDIKAYISNAIKAENVAQQMQGLARSKRVAI